MAVSAIGEKLATCPICEKRKAARFCPAKAETICAVCCGTEREVTIDCHSHCPHLASAHRYEDEHPRSVPADAPLLDINLPSDLVHTHQQLMAALAFTVARFGAEHAAATDQDVLAALEAFAETYRTLRSGIYYEKPPAAPLPNELYSALSAFVAELKQRQAERGGFLAINDSAIFYVVVFLYRMGLLRTNGRPRSRRFIEFLRGQFPEAPELKHEESRIIVP